MDKADTGVELGVACQAFLKTGHSNQNHPNRSGVEDRVYLFEAGHSEPVCLVDQD